MRRIGGQALIDGIIMTGKKCTAIVRRKSSGRINIETRNKCVSDSTDGIDRIFLIRGINYFIKLIKDVILNLNLYNIKDQKSSEESSILIEFIYFFSKSKIITFLVGIVSFLFMFFLLPEAIVNLFSIFLNMGNFQIQISSLIKMIIRLIIVFTYVIIISKNKDLFRILRYHGAEHKVINCYELKNKLTIENVKNASRFHRRCGSNFVVYIIICYFVVFLFVPRYSIGVNILIEILLLPFMLGLSYEIVEYIGRSNTAFSSILFSVSKGIQNFTTKEPKDDEIEVAIVALKTSEGLKAKNTIKELFLMGRSILRDAAVDSYALDSRLILEYCIGVTPTQVFTSEIEVSKEDEEKYLNLINERKNGKPIAYMIGKKEFYGNDLIVKEGVLIPRPDTEVLVEKVLEILKNKKEYTSICDLCCGTGAVGISIQKNNEFVNCTYIDNYDIPIKVTEENIYMYDLKNRSYITKSNLLEFFIENNLELDGIISNPPYIKESDIELLMKDVKDYEPHEALNGGEDGLDYYRKICEQAKSVLVDNGFIAFEIPDNKAFDIMYIMTNNNFVNIDIYKDINEKDRVIVGYYKSKID